MTEHHDEADNSARAALEAFANQDLPQLVYATATLVNLPFGTLEIDESAAAASYALSKADQYLRAMARIEDRRREIGLQSRRDLALANVVRASDPELAELLASEAILDAAEQEIEWHFFTVCASQIRRLLKLVTRIVGQGLSEEDERTLDTYQPLRNLFEHLDERLPGNEKGGRLVLDHSDETLLAIGLKSDNVGRFTVLRNGEEVIAEVNNVGLWQVEQAVQRTFDAIRSACLDLLRTELAAHPEKIPAADAIETAVLIRRRLLH